MQTKQDNMYLLDTLAKTLIEEEKVSGGRPRARLVSGPCPCIMLSRDCCAGATHDEVSS